MEQSYDFTTCRAICAELENKLGVYNWREVIEELKDGATDFEVAGYRFIAADNLDEIMRDELASDEYILGCFLPSFLSSILDMDQTAIQKIQDAAPEALGQLIIARGALHQLQREYVSADGYGHHFAHYDGDEWEMSSFPFSAFRVN